jgi:hypothetical protein
VLLAFSWASFIFWVGVTVVGGIVLVLILGGGKLLLTRPAVVDRWNEYKRSRDKRKMLVARYRQRLRCVNGHEWEEVVRYVEPRGWLHESGAERECPVCGNVKDGFQSLGVEPLNKQARQGRYI